MRDIFGRSLAKVDLGRISANVGIVRGLISAEVMIMAVVKANAYGHGLLEVSGACLRAGCEWLSVATACEGAALRAGFIDAPILVMGPVFGEEIDTLLTNELTATVFSTEFAENLSRAAVRMGKVANVHIKIDTGMNRLGFKPIDAANAIRQMARLAGLNIQGVYSHFAVSESDAEFTMKQFQAFDEITKGLGIEIRHISNSGGVLRHLEYNLDLVRVGVLVYGLAPCSTPEGANELAALGIKPALSLKSRVGHVKTVAKGESVGYGRNFYAEGDMEIATIPLGYGDGIIRALSNRGKVLINGHLCPIVGNICMDQFMVNASGARAVVGDEVVLIGRQGDAAINAENIAIWQGSINYEVTTAISHRVEREYLT